MKALTVCEPYASLIRDGLKRVENRTWRTSYRGSMYLHAGKSRNWLSLDPTGTIDQAYNMPVSKMTFGAVIATVELVDCIHIDTIRVPTILAKYPWLPEHEHANGPWCWILDKVVPIGPWPYKGDRGLFDIPDEALNRVANRQLGIPNP